LSPDMWFGLFPSDILPGYSLASAQSSKLSAIWVQLLKSN